VARTPPTPEVRLLWGDARRLEPLEPESVHLVVTSPPYPMIPQWDGLFAALGATDYSGMLSVLADAWRESLRVLVPGGLLAVNIGDALRTGTDGFRLWPNHAETLLAATRIGFTPLPYLLWKKPTNRPNAFLGSGFLPPNAYVTLDCEYILLFRKGGLRRFPPHDAAREASRFGRAERDRWFSQVWSDVRGVPQAGAGRRTGAFPPAIAERLVRMFSVVGDTVLDPFAGTGTTLWAAARLRRRAVGVEWDREVYSALRSAARVRRLRARELAPSPPEVAGTGGRSLPRRRSAGTGARNR
jgi:modification methylase